MIKSGISVHESRHISKTIQINPVTCYEPFKYPLISRWGGGINQMITVNHTEGGGGHHLIIWKHLGGWGGECRFRSL